MEFWTLGVYVVGFLNGVAIVLLRKELRVMREKYQFYQVAPLRVLVMENLRV